MDIKEIESKIKNLEASRLYLEKEIKETFSLLENLGISDLLKSLGVTSIEEAIKIYKENENKINEMEEEIKQLEKEIEILEKGI